MKSPPLYCEFTRTSLKFVAAGENAALPLERSPDGGLTAGCRARLAPALRQFCRSAGLAAQATAWCAIDARGVSLRCLLLPVVTGPALAQLVRMQIESEFPVSPEELAWGFSTRGEPQRQSDGALKQTVLVAAVKKELVEQYAEVLTAAGVVPIFTVAALARTVLCAPTPAAYAVLDLGTDQCELACFDGGAKAYVRLLPAASLTDAASVEALVKAIRSQWPGPKLYILGDAEVAAQITRRLPLDWACEPVRAGSAGGSSAALEGLKALAEEQGGKPLCLQIKPVAAPKKIAEPALVQWGICAAILLLAVLFFPVAEAMLFTAPLAAKVSAFQAKASELETNVDHDMDFLQALKQSQPPYLESFYLIAKAAPQGIHVELLSMNRRGEISLRGSLRNGDQVADFRSKLIASGYFASVTVEEQTPTPDHQKVNIRLTGQLKPLIQLEAVPVGPTAAELAGSTNAPAAGPGGMPGHGPMSFPGMVVNSGPN